MQIVPPPILMLLSKDFEEEQLDQAFSRLILYEPEPDEPTDADVQPKLRYNFPKSTFEAFCQSQINRVANTPVSELISRDAAVTPVLHSAGRRKPSLSQQEMEEQPWIPYRPRS